MNYLIKTGVFPRDNLLRFTKIVKSFHDFEYFTVFLKNRNFTSKIKRSKVTDYAALTAQEKVWLGELTVSQ